MLLVLTGLMFLFLVIVRADLTKDTKELLKQVMISLVILALTFIAVSKDKMEDELTLTLRLQAMAFAFIYSIGEPLVAPWVSKVMEGTWGKTSSDTMVFNMLVIYLLAFSFMKRAR